MLRRFAEYHDLEGAFGRRALTERAKGILMERHSVDESAPSRCCASTRASTQPQARRRRLRRRRRPPLLPKGTDSALAARLTESDRRYHDRRLDMMVVMWTRLP